MVVSLVNVGCITIPMAKHRYARFSVRTTWAAQLRVAIVEYYKEDSFRLRVYMSLEGVSLGCFVSLDLIQMLVWSKTNHRLRPAAVYLIIFA
jgi:hypothetical protein